MEILKIVGSFAGILGFIISLINIIYFFAIRRKNLYIRFGKMGVTKASSMDLLKVQYSFENSSQLPISVTRVQLLVNDKYYDCYDLPMIIEKAERARNGEIYDRDYIKSKSVPVNLLPLQADSGYFVFLIPRGTVSNSCQHLSFRICTNRGSAIEKTFELS